MSTLRRGALGLLASCMLGAAVFAQEVTITPLLKSGDEFSLQVTLARENSLRPEQSGKNTTSVDVRVVSADADGFTLDWIPGDSRIESERAADNPLVQAAADALRGLQLRLALNAAGTLTGVTNQSDVVWQMRKAVEPTVKALLEKLPAEQRPGFEKVLAQVLSPATLLMSITRDAHAYFSLNGVTLKAGESTTTALEQPNPFGGGVIPATFRVTLESATADTVVLTTSTTFDPAAVVRATRALIEQSGRTGTEKELAALPPLEMSDGGRFVLDGKIGLMREVVVNRRVTAGKDNRLDRWEIRLVRAPQR